MWPSILWLLTREPFAWANRPNSAPTIVKTIYPTASTVSQQLYTVPPYAVGAVFTVLGPLCSWKLDRRQIFLIAHAPFVMTGYAIFLATENQHVRYGGLFIICIGTFMPGALCNAQVSANVVSDTARSVAIAVNVTIGSLGGLVSTWSFLTWDGPDYHIGNGLNLAAASTIFIVTIVTLWWMKWDNKRRESRSVEEELAGLTQDEASDLEWKHPAFRWRP